MIDDLILKSCELRRHGDIVSFGSILGFVDNKENIHIIL